MAPTTPSVTQRIEELEEVMGNMESKISEMVSQAVEKAVVAMKHSLVELMSQVQEEAVMEMLMGRLERRTSREHQEVMIYSMKNDQEHFQAEVRLMLTSLQLKQQHNSEKEAWINHSDSVVKATTPTSSKVFEVGSMVGSPQTGRALVCWWKWVWRTGVWRSWVW